MMGVSMYSKPNNLFVGTKCRISYKRTYSARRIDGQECIITAIDEKDEYVHVVPIDDPKYMCSGCSFDEIIINGEPVPMNRKFDELHWVQRLLNKFLNFK